MDRDFHHTSFLRRPKRGVAVTDRVLVTLAESRHVVQDFTNERDEKPEMTIDDSVFTPVAARTNLYRDEACNAWRIRIPERANIALDTVAAHARGPRRNHAALVFEDDDATVGRYSFADLDALSDRLAKGLSALGARPASQWRCTPGSARRPPSPTSPSTSSAQW